MLMKSFVNNLFPTDFEKSLKLRRLISLGLLAVGLIGFACYFLLVPDSSLPEFAQGFYLGAASGIVLGAVVLFFRTQYLLNHPDARKKAQVQEQDEREVTIRNKAFMTAGVVAFFVSAGALFVVLPLSIAAFRALLGTMILYGFSFVVSTAYFSRKL